MALIGGWKFKGNTDSEAMARFFEEELEDGVAIEDIYKRRTNLFLEWGVLIRYDLSSKNIEIYKTKGRTLYELVFEDAVILISEPTTTMASAKKCTELIEGIFTFNVEIPSAMPLFKSKFKDVTKKLRPFFDWRPRKIRCDLCNKLRMCIVEDKSDYCMPCLLSGEKAKRTTYKSYRQTERQKQLANSFNNSVKLLKNEFEKPYDKDEYAEELYRGYQH